MASKVDSPWDAQVALALANYDLSSVVENALHADLVTILEQAYHQGMLAAIHSEREQPHREDMGR